MTEEEMEELCEEIKEFIAEKVEDMGIEDAIEVYGEIGYYCSASINGLKEDQK